MAGVPADVIFQGRFASKTTAQLTLLNTTVSQLAKSINSVLTMAYRDIYGEDEGDAEPSHLQLLTSPLSATEEVLSLYTAGLAPLEIAMPAVLHAIGASNDEIEKAVEKAMVDAEQKCACEAQDRAFQQEDQQLALDERRAAIAAAPAKEKVGGKQAEDKVAQTEAGTKKLSEEAKVGGKSKPTASSSK